MPPVPLGCPLPVDILTWARDLSSKTDPAAWHMVLGGKEGWVEGKEVGSACSLDTAIPTWHGEQVEMEHAVSNQWGKRGGGSDHKGETM